VRIERIAGSHVPTAISQGVDVLRVLKVGSRELKSYVGYVKVTRAANSSMDVKRHVLACRMVQRKICYETLLAMDMSNFPEVPGAQDEISMQRVAEVTRVKKSRLPL